MKKKVMNRCKVMKKKLLTMLWRLKNLLYQ